MSKIRYGNLEVIALGTKQKYKTSPQRITFLKHTNIMMQRPIVSFDFGYFKIFYSADFVINIC